MVCTDLFENSRVAVVVVVVVGQPRALTAAAAEEGWRRGLCLYSVRLKIPRNFEKNV